MLPESHLIEVLKEIVTGDSIKIIDIIELAKDFGVSTEAIFWRLVNLNKLERDQVQKILDDPRFRDMDCEMRQELYSNSRLSKFPLRFVFPACRCLMEGKISRGTFAEYLEIDRTEIDDRLAEEGFMEKNSDMLTALIEQSTILELLPHIAMR